MTHKLLFGLIVGTTVCALVLPTMAQAIEYGGIGGRPAFPRVEEPRSESIFLHQVTLGEVIEDGIKVINNSSESKTLIIYSTDQSPSTDGAFACKQLSDSQDGVGAWIDLEQTEIRLPSVSAEVVPFTITIPTSADVGEHNGCIIVQEKKEKSASAGLNLSFRTGVRVALTIPGDIVRQLALLSFSASNRETVVILTPTIENQGNVSVDTDVKIIVTNLLSRSEQVFGGEYVVLRDNPLVLNFDFTKPYWGGVYTAQAQIEYENDDGIQTIASSIVMVPIVPQTPALAVYGGGMLLAIGLILALVLRYLRRRRRLINWETYTTKPHDSLTSLVRSRQASWKEVVRVNKLKPPYELRAGNTIKLPPKP